MIRMIHMEVDHLTLYIIVYNPPKSKTTPLFGRLLFMDDHPFEATGFFRPGWVTTKSWEFSCLLLSPALSIHAWWLYESHGHPLTTTGSYTRPPKGTQQKQGKNKNQGTLQLLVVQLTTPATSCKQKGRRFGRNCHNPLAVPSDSPCSCPFQLFSQLLHLLVRSRNLDEASKNSSPKNYWPIFFAKISLNFPGRPASTMYKIAQTWWSFFTDVKISDLRHRKVQKKLPSLLADLVGGWVSTHLKNIRSSNFHHLPKGSGWN